MMGGPVSPGLASEDSELSPHSSPREWGKCSLFSPFLSFDPWREEKLLWVWGATDAMWSTPDAWQSCGGAL